MKYFEDNLLNVTHPSFVDYYKHIIKTVRDEICRVIDENGDLLKVFDKYLTEKSDDKLNTTMILYQAVLSLKQQGNISSILCQQQNISSTFG
jgi:hypothetical protein